MCKYSVSVVCRNVLTTFSVAFGLAFALCMGIKFCHCSKFLKRSLHAWTCVHAKLSKRPRPLGHCVLDRQSLKGFAALCGKSVSWSKSETGKLPGMALEPVCYTSNLTSTSVSNQGAHWLIFYALTSAVLIIMKVKTCTRCKDVHGVINNHGSWSGRRSESECKLKIKLNAHT